MFVDYVVVIPCLCALTHAEAAEKSNNSNDVHNAACSESPSFISFVEVAQERPKVA